MCLTITVEARAQDREALVAAAKQAERFGLHIEVGHESRLPWAKHRPVRAEVTEDGGCACSLLSDDDEEDGPAWSMRPEVVEPLALTLEALAQSGPLPLTLEALWIGDRPNDEVQITPSDVAALVRRQGLGTTTRYIIERAG